jgi:transposase
VKRLSKSKSDGKVSMFVGMDLHKNFLQIAVMNKEGRVLRNSKIDNNLKQIGGFFNDIDDKAHIVMESASVCYNIYRYLSEERSFNVILSNPVKTRAIASAKIKTDKLPYEISSYLS